MITSRQGNCLLRIAAFCAVLTLLQSCVIFPDPWREELFKEIPHSDSGVEYDRQLEMIVTASGYQYEQHSPYGISMRYIGENPEVTSVVVNGFAVTIAGREIPDLWLHNTRSPTPVELLTETVEIIGAPCCVFWLVSNRFELTHTKGEMMTVRFDYCLISSGRRDCNVEERQFKAIIRRGFFQMAGV
jgi:hypothetical protein